jgi:ABC-type branched-subunit amino acid transport system substrate-binding protein
VLSLGTLLPRTGQFVYSGPAQEAAVQLAMQDINDAGGVPAIVVKLDAANQRDEGIPLLTPPSSRLICS